MTSIEIKDFSATLEKFINEYDLPWEVKRLVVEDICRKVTNQANNELLEQAKERESKQSQ